MTKNDAWGFGSYANTYGKRAYRRPVNRRLMTANEHLIWVNAQTLIAEGLDEDFVVSLARQAGAALRNHDWHNAALVRLAGEVRHV